jgi:ATP-dependent Clp protease ATP-binding subunit ClpA
VLDRFSDRSRRVVASAQEEARKLGHQHVGTEHLLLGLLLEPDTAAGRALIAAGASVDAARQKVVEAVGRRPPGTDADLPFTVRASRALDFASRLSIRRRDAHVEPEHVLLSVLDVEGTAGQILRGIGVDVAALRHTVEHGPPKRNSRAKAKEAEVEDLAPLCPVCGETLETTLAQRVVQASGSPRSRRGFLVVYCSACGSALGASPT